MSRACRIESERCQAARRNGERCTLSGRAIVLATGEVAYLCGNHTGSARKAYDERSERMRGVA